MIFRKLRDWISFTKEGVGDRVTFFKRFGEKSHGDRPSVAVRQPPDPSAPDGTTDRIICTKRSAMHNQTRSRPAVKGQSRLTTGRECWGFSPGIRSGAKLPMVLSKSRHEKLLDDAGKHLLR